MRKATGPVQLTVKIDRPDHPGISMSVGLAPGPGRPALVLHSVASPSAGVIQVRLQRPATPATEHPRGACAASPALALPPIPASGHAAAMAAEKFTRRWLQERLQAWSAMP